MIKVTGSHHRVVIIVIVRSAKRSGIWHHNFLNHMMIMTGAFLIFLATELGLLRHLSHQVTHQIFQARNRACREMNPLKTIIIPRASTAVLFRLSNRGRPTGLNDRSLNLSNPRGLLMLSGNQLVQATGGRRRTGHPFRLVGSLTAQRFASLTREPQS